MKRVTLFVLTCAALVLAFYTGVAWREYTIGVREANACKLIWYHTHSV